MSGLGMGGHQLPVNDKDEWLTPPHVLSALGKFDLDPCACDEPRPWPTADRHFVRADNGLALPWSGRVFLNPPYGGPSIVGPWVRRMVEHGHGTALIFARTETEIFHECVWGAASAIFFFAGRLTFCHRTGKPAQHNGGAPSCLVAYGAADARALLACRLPGHFVPLPGSTPRRDLFMEAAE